MNGFEQHVAAFNLIGEFNDAGWWDLLFFEKGIDHCGPAQPVPDLNAKGSIAQRHGIDILGMGAGGHRAAGIGCCGRQQFQAVQVGRKLALVEGSRGIAASPAQPRLPGALAAECQADQGSQQYLQQAWSCLATDLTAPKVRQVV